MSDWYCKHWKKLVYWKKIEIQNGSFIFLEGLNLKSKLSQEPENKK